MWAIKNFVHGPSAAVALWPGPYPGALNRKQNAMAAMQPTTLQNLTM